MFSGVRFVLIGFDSVSEAQYRSEIVNAGGVDVGRYDDSCTHVIVHDRVYDDPVCVAARHDGKTLVTSLWVEDSLELGKLADVSRVLYQPVKDLKGISGSGSMCICLTGYQKPQRDDIMKMVDLMGAQFSKPLIAAKVTHLVCYKFEGEKYELAKRTKMKLVNHRWLEDCLKSWAILPVDGYNKSGWEIELMEAQASDSEKETEKDVTEPAKLQNGLICGSSGPLMPLREIDQHAMTGGARSCDAEESLVKNRPRYSLEKETTSDKFDKIVDSVGRNDLASVSDRVSKSGSTLGTDEIDKIEVRELGRQSFNFDAEDEKCYLAKEACMTNGKDILDERPANVDKETYKLSPNVRRNRISSSLQTPDGKTPASFRKVTKSLSSGSLVADCKGNPIEVDYLNANSNALPDEDCIMTEAHHGDIDGDGTPVGQFSNFKCGLSINKKNKKRSSHFDVANGNYGSLNISRKSFKKSPDRSSTLLHSSSAGFIDNKSIEGISDNSMITGAHSDVKCRSPEFQISCVAEAKEGLMQEPTITENRKVHDSVVTPSPLKPGGKNAAEALSRNVESSETGQSHMIINEPQSGLNNSSSSFENSNSTNLIMNKTLDLPKAKCLSLKKPLKHGRTILQAKSSVTSKVVMENNKKEQSSDTFLQDVAQLKSDSNCNDAPVTMNRHSNTHSGEMGKLLIPQVEVEVLSPRDSDYKKCELQAHGDVDVHPVATFRKKTYAKKSTGIGRKLSTSHFKKSEKNNSGVNNVDAKEAKLDGRNQEGSGFEEIISNVADASRMNQAKQGIFTSTTADLETYVDAEKENRPSQSGNVSLKPDKKGFQKAAAKSSTTKTKVTSLKVVHRQPACFILSGHRLQRKEFQQIIRRLKGKFCRDSHQWSYQATHFIVPDPVRRTEKFFAATAAGRWVLKEDYLIASNQAGRFMEEDTYEWYKNGLNEDSTINMEIPRKWRLLRERTGHGAFYGMRIIVYGECIAPPLDTLKRVVKAGDGVILATSPPFSRFLKSGIDFAIVGAGMPQSDCWIQEFLKHEIPCVVADYLVEYVCKFGYPLDRHVLYDTHSWAERSMQNLLTRAEEIVEPPSDDAGEDEDNDGANDDDVACLVCCSRDRGEVMLICGDEGGSLGCGAGSHIDCCDPPFEAVPEDDWFCPQCATGIGSTYRSTNISSKNRTWRSSRKS